jgi:hypothetical protein
MAGDRARFHVVFFISSRPGVRIVLLTTVPFSRFTWSRPNDPCAVSASISA